MQFGQVPIQYVAEAPVNDMRAVTVAPRGAEALAPAPGARGGEPIPVGTRPGEAPAVVVDGGDLVAPVNWLMVGGLLLLLMMVGAGGRR